MDMVVPWIPPMRWLHGHRSHCWDQSPSDAAREADAHEGMGTTILAAAKGDAPLGIAGTGQCRAVPVG